MSSLTLYCGLYMFLLCSEQINDDDDDDNEYLIAVVSDEFT